VYYPATEVVLFFELGGNEVTRSIYVVYYPATEVVLFFKLGGNEVSFRQKSAQPARRDDPLLTVTSY
jgi:hypothetical protein